MKNMFVYHMCRCKFRGGSRISEKGVRMYKDIGFALLTLSHFS